MIKEGIRRRTLGLLCVTLLIDAGALIGNAARASDFGCAGLEQNALVASIEGSEGYFFRILSDIRMQHQLSDHTAVELGRLAHALEAAGTTLVYVPIPPKSLVLPRYLPDRAAELGFDYDIAVAAHQELLRKLRQQGVVTVDILPALRDTGTAHPPFIKADFHWTAWGAAAAASEVASVIRQLPGSDALKTASFETHSSGRQAIISTMRRRLQASCLSSLPAAEMDAFETVEIVRDDASGQDIFGGAETSGKAVLVGTSFSDLPSANFAGFLSQELSSAVENYALSGGNQFGSITAYMTSSAFLESRPRFLIWENPVYNNLGKYGDAPLKELTAAAASNCNAVPITQGPEIEGNVLSLSVDRGALSSSAVISAYAGNQASRQALLRLAMEDGESIETRIVRPLRASSSGRYFFALDGRMKPIKTLQIAFDDLSPGRADVVICSASPQEEN